MFDLDIQIYGQLRNKINHNYRIDETSAVQNLLEVLDWNGDQDLVINNLARELIVKVRQGNIKATNVNNLMREFKLSTTEGVSLMCLAESLLRIPDKYTQFKLIREKITNGQWQNYLKTNNFFVNAASWGLLISGKLVAAHTPESLSGTLHQMLKRLGEPVIYKAVLAAVKIMGGQFVIGQTIEQALKQSVSKLQKGYRFSYDMLGEAALTNADAEYYMQSYVEAIHAVGINNAGRGVKYGDGVSVKLSALHPRYSRAQRAIVMAELLPRIKKLYLLAQHYQIGLFIDAEESERLDISLDLLECIVNDKDLQGFAGVGFVVQAYQKRAIHVIDYIAELAKNNVTRIMLRLVKGAYWDSEIKKAQIDGQIDYPVFTRKFHSDVSYLACAKKMLENPLVIYPLFATHNAHSVAAIYSMAKNCEYEFQCLYGMGEQLYDNIVGIDNLNVTCRIYAPVGNHKTLLAYLVRRLLENGANSSFVHQIVDPSVGIDELLLDPIQLAIKTGGVANPNLAKPTQLFMPSRVNSLGMDFSDEQQLSQLQMALNQFSSKIYYAKPILLGHQLVANKVKDVMNPADLADKIGELSLSDVADVNVALDNAVRFLPKWVKLTINERSSKIRQFADLLEVNHYELIHLLVREAGKTLINAVGEIREAVDFCRYYASQIEHEFINENRQPLGIIVSISPWNFPLAIFTGEIISALAAGNVVIAKPAQTTSIIAYYVVNLMIEAGINVGAIQLLLGSGKTLGDKLTADPRVNGVIFTGSTEVAQSINRNLANKDSTSVLIAETGGQNTMIVDSTALAEQVVNDVIASGFDSAGQRCSALRVLYLQADIADKVIEMLKGAMDELVVAKPNKLSTDIGPVIDKSSQQNLLAHIENMKARARMYYQVQLSSECDNGIFVAPTIFEIGSLSELKSEVFGPIIHIIRFDGDGLDQVIEEINSSGYGLTQGVHSRVEGTISKVFQQIRAGNFYVNRNMIGAVVGVQPFGGEGLSGTGPKAGGPLYVQRLTKQPLRLYAKSMLYKIDNNKVIDWQKLDSFTNNLAQLDLTELQIVQLIELTGKLKAYSALTKQLEFTGPTGEQNFMFFMPRGWVLCVADSLYEYCVQIIYTLATANHVILWENQASFQLKRFLPEYAYFVNELAEAKTINLVLFMDDSSNNKDMRIKLAARGGLLSQVVIGNSSRYDHYLLLNERTVSVNLTAIGGNTQLMSMHDEIL